MRTGTCRAPSGVCGTEAKCAERGAELRPTKGRDLGLIRKVGGSELGMRRPLRARALGPGPGLPRYRNEST